MSFGQADGATVGYRKRQNSTSTGTVKTNSGSGIRGIVNRTRLTEDDLEHFRLSIIAAHKKKHYKFLAIFILIIILLGILVFFFIL